MTALTREQVISALDSGTLLMMRPWGDYVPVRRRRKTKRGGNRNAIVQLWMERAVEAAITQADEKFGFACFKIAGRI